MTFLLTFVNEWVESAPERSVMSALKLLSPALLLVILGACGGSQVPIVTDPDVVPEVDTETPPLPTIDARAQIANGLADQTRALGLVEADLLTEPEIIGIGTASYKGAFNAASADDDNPQGIFGDAELNVNLAGDVTVSGAVTNLTFTDLGMNTVQTVNIPANATLTPLAGSLDFTRGAVAKTGPTDPGSLVVVIDGAFTLPSALNNDQGPVDVGVGGSVVGLMTEDQIFGGTGLIFVREDNQALQIYQALFLGDKQYASAIN